MLVQLVCAFASLSELLRCEEPDQRLRFILLLSFSFQGLFFFFSYFICACDSAGIRELGDVVVTAVKGEFRGPEGFAWSLAALTRSLIPLLRRERKTIQRQKVEGRDALWGFK